MPNLLGILCVSECSRGLEWKQKFPKINIISDSFENPSRFLSMVCITWDKAELTKLPDKFLPPDYADESFDTSSVHDSLFTTLLYCLSLTIQVLPINYVLK